MEIKTDTPEALALDRAVATAGGKTSLMRKLNERGWEIGSHNTITQWRENGVPEKYCPDIEDITGVRCEELSPKANWAVLRKTPRRKAA
jgi:DNA-binding transcriptional regulator YdaS (Cro superfamily)